uniref:Bulb-type lectin domain-containing protein n=1 Tax=Leersia perrieri TaxID=77586 RepID=A0A0D9UZK7_9ORYZ
MAMDDPPCRFLLWFLCFVACVLLESAAFVHSCCPLHPSSGQEAKFEQKTYKFWEYQEQSNTWVEISMPFNLMSCINDTCTKVGSIEQLERRHGRASVSSQEKDTEIDSSDQADRNDPVLPIRKRISLTRMSESSVWVTGQSGSIYERFWNGLAWVIAPHELPISAGYATATFIVNTTILALSEAGILYQLQLNEHAQPIWTEVIFNSDQQFTDLGEIIQSQAMHIRNGIVSCDGRKLFLSITNGSLLEITELQPLRWTYHGRPPGGDVSYISDAGNARPGTVFTVSSMGDLYEFNKDSRPSWKKHIWSEETAENVSLSSSVGCALHGLLGSNSVSLFLITKDGLLVERRLHRRKWKWYKHGAPKSQKLSSITEVQQDESNDATSMYLTTSTGKVFEYQFPKYTGGAQSNKIRGLWVNHMFPENTKLARNVRGVQVQVGRVIFPLDDGRLGELHLPGMGGDDFGPSQQYSMRRKVPNKYEWSILDAPETEGWNAEYCTEEHGPTNCITGAKNIAADNKPNDLSNNPPSRKRKDEDKQQYLYVSTHERDETESYNFLSRSIDLNFHMRVMHADRSLFLITDNGLTFEYLNNNGVWLWLRHEHTTSMKGTVGSYNGSLYLVDVYGNLHIRERNGDELLWINCTAMKKGRQVVSGSPWDGVPGLPRRVTTDDALFFVNKRGRLLQFTVALRKFKWKDCQSPPDTKIAFIVDQEVFRRNIIFVVGRNGRLYQYNRITELWHKHYQSPHLILSRSPGTAMRPFHLSLTGSIFMVSEHGGLVEYHFSSQDGWEWVEHGTPHRDVTIIGAPGPCFDGSQLFVIGSDGNVYRRHLDNWTWRWTSHGHPSAPSAAAAALDTAAGDKSCATPGSTVAPHYADGFVGICDEKVAGARPVPFSEDAVVFELRDGRLAELRRGADGCGGWEWARIIGTPASACMTSYWTAVAT